MRCFDVFNGDADGICALHQLRLAEPLEAELVTGTKRDIDLLRRVEAGAGDRVTVLDVSLERNRAALLALLERGARIRYFDHHAAGEVPSHPGLEAHIDESAGVCTSILVDRHLKGRFRRWAVVAAFGDGMREAATRLAAGLGLDTAQLAALRELGENLNYNAYGDSEADLLVPPADLYRIVSRFADPFGLLEREPLLSRLGKERREDLSRARSLAPYPASARSDAFILPDAQWARRREGAPAGGGWGESCWVRTRRAAGRAVFSRIASRETPCPSPGYARVKWKAGSGMTFFPASSAGRITSRTSCARAAL